MKKSNPSNLGLYAWMFLCGAAVVLFGWDAPACQSGVADGTITVDGRPLVWKLRELNWSPNYLVYKRAGIDDSDGNGVADQYSYVAVIDPLLTNPKGEEIRMGLNMAGLVSEQNAIIGGNSGWPNSHFLGHMATVAEVRNYANSVAHTNMEGIYFLGDVSGDTCVWEVNVTNYYAVYEYDTRNTSRASQTITTSSGTVNRLGFVVRYNSPIHAQTNGADNATGDSKTASGEGGGGSGVIALNKAAGNFSVKTLWQGHNGTSGKPDNFDFMRSQLSPNHVSATAVLGVLTNEDPRLSTMFTALGDVYYSIAIPVWALVTNLPPTMNNGNSTCFAKIAGGNADNDGLNVTTNDIGLYRKFPYVSGKGGDTNVMLRTLPMEAKFFDAVLDKMLPEWRARNWSNTGAVARVAGEMTRVENQMAADAYSLLERMLNGTHDNNNAPIGSQITAASVSQRTVNLAATAVDSDGTITNVLWNYGDGQTGTSTSHVYAASGTYLISYTVTDNDGVSFTDWNFVNIGNDLSIVTDVSNVTVQEGNTNTFKIKLSAAPATDVSVTVGWYSGSTNIQVVGTTQFVFTADNWDIWVTNQIYSVHDADLLHDTATVVCTASGGIPSPIYVSVSQFDVDARHITLSTNLILWTYVAGSYAPTGIAFSVMNTGGGTMNYSAATNASWLTVTPASVTGLGSGTAQVHVLSVRTNGLVPGVSNAVITITSSQADNTPQTISVSMTVDYAPIPVLSFSPTNLNFVWSGPAGTVTNLSVGFEGMATGTNMPSGWTQVKYGSAVWKIQKGGYTGGSHPTNAHSGSNNVCLYYTTDATNLLITPAINFGSSTSAVLTFWHTQELWAPDQDQLTVQYRTNASAGWVTLTNYTTSISVWTQRTLSLPTLSTNYQVAFRGWATYGYGICLDDIQVVSYGPFGGGGGTGVGPGPQTITVSNSGHGYLQVSNVWTAPWLNVQPGSASNLSFGQSAQFTVSILTNTIRIGTNTAVLTLTSTNAANAPVQIPVTLSVATNLTAWQLTVSSANPQWGSANPSSGFYLSGLPVRLSALASNYYNFVQWTGGVQGASAVTDIVLSADTSATAVFDLTVLTNDTPAWWLGQYNLPTTDTGALTDSDSDGLAAWQEYITGTDPTNAASTFQLTALQDSTAAHIVKWAAVSGRVYSVYWSSNLLNGFQVLQSNIPWSGAGSIFTDTVHNAELNGFYQIKVQEAP